MPRFYTSNSGSGTVSASNVTGLSAYVNGITNTAINSLIAGAPSTLNTLNEIATSIGDNADFVDAVLLKSGGTMTGNINMGASAILSSGAISCGALTLGSTAVTSTAAELNQLHSVTAGTTSASKALVVDSSSNIAGLGQVNASAIRANDFRGPTSSSVPTITLPSGQYISFQTGNYVTPIETTVEVMRVTPTSLLVQIIGALSSTVSMSCPLLTAGLCPATAGIMASASIGSGCAISSVPQYTSQINITTANTARVLAVIAPSSSFLNGQRITVKNASGNNITLAHKYNSNTGALRCFWKELANGCCIVLVYDSTYNCFYAEGVNEPETKVWRSRRWANDDALGAYISPTIGTYVCKANFQNNTTTICGVSGFDYVSALTSITGTNWSITITSGSFLYFTSGDASYFTSGVNPQSYGLTNFIYASSTTIFTLNLTGLTLGKTYMLCFYSPVFDTAPYNRLMTRTDADYPVSYSVDAEVYMTGTGTAVANDVGTIWSYSWVQNSNCSGTKVFNISSSTYHLCAFTVCDITP